MVPAITYIELGVRLIFFPASSFKYCAIASEEATQIPHHCSNARNEILYLREITVEEQAHFCSTATLERLKVSGGVTEEGRKATFTSQTARGRSKAWEKVKSQRTPYEVSYYKPQWWNMRKL